MAISPTGIRWNRRCADTLHLRRAYPSGRLPPGRCGCTRADDRDPGGKTGKRRSPGDGSGCAGKGIGVANAVPGRCIGKGYFPVRQAQLEASQPAACQRGGFRALPRGQAPRSPLPNCSREYTPAGAWQPVARAPTARGQQTAPARRPGHLLPPTGQPGHRAGLLRRGTPPTIAGQTIGAARSAPRRLPLQRLPGRTSARPGRCRRPS